MEDIYSIVRNRKEPTLNTKALEYITDKHCKECHEEIMRRLRNVNGLFITVLTFMGLLIIVGGWLGITSQTAANEARLASGVIKEHIIEDDAEDKAVSRSLQGIESRQIRMGERIDSIFEKMGKP